MKKIFTLISMALAAMSVNAQEVWKASDLTLSADGKFVAGLTATVNNSASYAIPASAQVFPEGTYVDGTTLPEAVATWLSQQADPSIYAAPLNEVVFEAKTTSVTLKGVSTPNTNVKVEEAWNFAGAEENKTLTMDGMPTFVGYVKGNTGNPSVGHYEFVDLNSDGGECSRVADAVWAPGLSVLPGKGCYYEVTCSANGTLTLGVWLNKNLASNKLCVVDESANDGYTILTGDAIKVQGFRNNNGWEGADVTLPLTFPVGEDGLVLQPAEATQTSMNQPLFAYVTWTAKKDATYMVFTPSNQLGLMGFQFTPGGETAISTVKTAAESADAPIYNLAGQKVDKSFKGVVIQNGVKRIQK